MSTSQEQDEACLLETVRLDHIPETHQTHLAFFRDVSNVDFLHAQLLAKNPDFDYAFIDASSLMSRDHLLSAVWRAIMFSLSDRLLTATIHSEIVLCLSPKNNIAEAYRRWGITPGKTKDIVVVKVVVTPPGPLAGTRPPPTPEQILAHLTSSIKGTPTARLSTDEIRKSTNWANVRKYYNLNNVPVLKLRQKGKEEDLDVVEEMEAIIMGSMSLRLL